MLSETPKYYDSQGNRVDNVNVVGKVHKQVIAKLVQKAGGKDYASIHKYIERLIDERC